MLEVAEMLEGDALCATLYAGGFGGRSRWRRVFEVVEGIRGAAGCSRCWSEFISRALDRTRLAE